MIPIPCGEAVLPFYRYENGCRKDVNLKCSVEITLACFTRDTCRVRGVFLEAGAGHAIGDVFSNKDTALTDELMRIIRETPWN